MTAEDRTQLLALVDDLRSRGAREIEISADGGVRVVFGASAPTARSPAWPAHQQAIVDERESTEVARALRDRDELWSAPGPIAGLRAVPRDKP